MNKPPTKSHSRISDAIHIGVLGKAKRTADPAFGCHVVTACPEVSKGILQPRDAWADKKACDAAARKLAGLFRENFKTYEAEASAETQAAGPA